MSKYILRDIFLRTGLVVLMSAAAFGAIKLYKNAQQISQQVYELLPTANNSVIRIN